jgi:hypothetical protein
VRASHLGEDRTFEGDEEQRTTTDWQRPATSENDAWDAAKVGDSERYQGRRRASMARRRWLIVAAAVVVMAGAVTLAMTWGSVDTPPSPADSTHSAGDPRSSTPSNAQTNSLASRAPTPSPSAGTSPATPRFAALTFEAEAGSPLVTLSGSAHVHTDPGASGGKIVGGLGAQDDGRAPGALRVNNVTVPASGVYLITIYYINSDKPGSSSGAVSVSGARSVTAKFTGGRGCCGVKQIEIALAAGVHTITISNATGIAPSVDKISLSRPA